MINKQLSASRRGVVASFALYKRGSSFQFPRFKSMLSRNSHLVKWCFFTHILLFYHTFSADLAPISLSALKSYPPSSNILYFFNRPVFLIPLKFHWQRFLLFLFPLKVRNAYHFIWNPAVLALIYWDANKKPLELRSRGHSGIFR